MSLLHCTTIHCNAAPFTAPKADQQQIAWTPLPPTRDISEVPPQLQRAMGRIPKNTSCGNKTVSRQEFEQQFRAHYEKLFVVSP